MLRKVYARLPLGLQQSLLTIVGNAFTTFFSAIALILISRWLGPTDFGEFSVGFALVLILSRVCDWGFSTILLKYIPRYEESDSKNRLINFSIFVKVTISLIVLLSGLLLSPLLIQQLNFTQPVIIYAAFITVIATVLFEQLLYTLQALHRFNQAIVSNAIQSITKVVGVLVLMALKLKQGEVFFVFYMLAPLAPVLIFKRLMPNWFRFKLKNDTAHFKSIMMGLAPHAAVAYIIAGIVENIDVLFVRNYLSAYETGLLGGVNRISMFIMLIGYSLGNVLYPRVARYQQKVDMRKYLQKASIISLMCVVSTLLFFPFAQLLIVLTIGPDYASGAGILNVLAVSSFLALASIPFIAVFYAFEYSWLFSMSGFGQLLIILIGNMLFVPVYGLEAAVYTRLVSKVFLFIFAFTVAFVLYQKHHVYSKNKN